MTEIASSVRGIFEKLGTRSELHFREYNHDKHLEKYFRVLNYIINQEINLNLLVVNNTEAQSIAQQLDLTTMELRGCSILKYQSGYSTVLLGSLLIKWT